MKHLTAHKNKEKQINRLDLHGCFLSSYERGTLNHVPVGCVASTLTSKRSLSVNKDVENPACFPHDPRRNLAILETLNKEARGVFAFLPRLQREHQHRHVCTVNMKLSLA